MPKHKRWFWNHNGFHGCTAISINVPVEAKAGDIVTVSDPVAYRVNRAVCPSATCVCGEFVAVGNEISIPDLGATVHGRYPTRD